MAIGCRFDVPPDGFVFTTKANGDQIRITNIDLSQQDAASLAGLIGSKVVLTVQIKEKTD